MDKLFWIIFLRYVEGWGAPRIHGGRLKLGIDISEATVSKYMARRQNPPSQTWRTFLGNHADCTAGIDFFTVPTATFRVLYVFIVLSHDRRHIVHFNVTAHPSAETVWIMSSSSANDIYVESFATISAITIRAERIYRLTKIRLKLDLLNRQKWEILWRFPMLVACTFDTGESQPDGDSNEWPE